MAKSAQAHPLLFDLYAVTTKPSKMPIRRAGDPRVARLLKLFDALHRQHVRGEPAVITGAKDGKLLKADLATRDEAELGRHMARFFPFALSDPWIRSRGLTIGMFHHCLPALVLNDTPEPEPTHPWLDAIEDRLTRWQFQYFAGARVVSDGVTTALELADADTVAWVLKHYSREVAAAAEAAGLAAITVRVKS